MEIKKNDKIIYMLLILYQISDMTGGKYFSCDLIFMKHINVYSTYESEYVNAFIYTYHSKY